MVSKLHVVLGAAVVVGGIWMGSVSRRSHDVSAGQGVGDESPAASPAPSLKAIRCALKRLPESPLRRRNLIAALRRLDSTVIPAGEALDLEAALGPWTGDDYSLAPCSRREYRGCVSPSDAGYVACFGAGAEAAAFLATSAARAAGLEIKPPEAPNGLLPAPVQPGLRIANPTERPARFTARWESGKPVIMVAPGAAGSKARVRSGGRYVREVRCIAAVGDVVCDPRAAPGVRKDPRDLMVSPIAQALQQADIVLANLECPLTTSHQPTRLKRRADLARRREFLFKGDPQAATALLGAFGVDVATLANNHIFDYGPDGIDDTHNALRRCGMLCAGPGADDSAPHTVCVPAGGHTCRMIAFVTSETLPAGAVEKLTGPWVLDTRPEHIAAAKACVGELVGASRQRGEAPIVCFHWGVEGSAEPSACQRELARVAARAGAALVIGHHPHRLQPIDTIEGCVVAYSLGNFVFAPVRKAQALTGVLIVALAEGRPFAAGLMPARIAPDGIPELLADSDEETMAAILEDLGVAE